MSLFNEWGEALEKALAEPFPPEAHKSKRQGGQQITFVDVHRYKERLNATVGPAGWSTTVRLEPIGGKMVCTVALTILGVTKENVGDEVEVPEVNERGNEKIIGSPATNSYSQAFKRAASDFGLGAYLYDEEDREAAKRGALKAAKTEDRQKLAGMVEEIEKLPLKLNKANEAVKKDALGLALNGGTQADVDKALEWADTIIQAAKEKVA